jgi:hypothetical protein
MTVDLALIEHALQGFNHGRGHQPDGACSGHWS